MQKPLTLQKRNDNRRRATNTQNGHQLVRAKRILRHRLPELRRRYHVKSLGLFGSYVRGEQKRQSDLDVLVEFDQPPTLLEFVHLKRHLSELVGIKVDLVLKKTLKPNIGRYVLSELVPIG